MAQLREFLPLPPSASFIPALQPPQPTQSNPRALFDSNNSQLSQPNERCWYSARGFVVSKLRDTRAYHERANRPGQTQSQRQSRSQSESHSSASSSISKCTNGVKVCESRLVLKRSWIRVVVVCAVRCTLCQRLLLLRSSTSAPSALSAPVYRSNCK